MPSDPQIRERMDSGDFHGAARLALKQILPELTAKAQATQVSLDTKIADAAGQFFARHPELQPADEASALEFGRQMGVVVRKLGLDGFSVEHWESAWTVEQAKRVATRPRQETVAPLGQCPNPPSLRTN